jgi:pimeloyl-ACP methyl ester carboxylesterase
MRHNNEPPPPGGANEVARLLQRIAVSAVLLAVLCLIWWWPRSPLLALAACSFWLLGYSVLLGFELMLMHRVNLLDPAPRARVFELMRAWWAETRVAARVFAWRQPFRSQAVPDQLGAQAVRGQRGVVFVHGLFCNRGFWTPWLQRLEGGPHAFVAISLEPAFSGIDSYVTQIDLAVRQVHQACGMPPLMVCHSMGGLAARAWLKKMQGAARVHRVVTLGTPHHGTWLARFGRSHNGRQMRQGSEWLKELNRPETHTAALTQSGTEAPWQALFTCWYSNCDNIVFPASTATLAGADNRLVRGAAHVQLAFMPEVMNATLALLQTPPGGES